MVIRPLRVVAALTFAAALAGAVVTAAGPSGPAAVDAPADRLTQPGRALVTSDSAWLAIKSYGTIDAVQGFHHDLALASCRRRVATSCRNYDGSVPTTSYEEVVNHGSGYDTLVQAAGYDDGADDFAAEVAQTIAAARELGYRRVVWVTLRANVSYDSTGHIGYAAVYEQNNAALAEMVATGLYPELVIADWATYAYDRHEWFSADGIHMTSLGAYAAADYLSRKMAFLDGRACPLPAAPSELVPTPCPDPDVVGPVVDLAGLYPTTRYSPHAGRILIWEGHGSWPNLPWWEL